MSELDPKLAQGRSRTWESFDPTDTSHPKPEVKFPSQLSGENLPAFRMRIEALRNAVRRRVTVSIGQRVLPPLEADVSGVSNVQPDELNTLADRERTQGFIDQVWERIKGIFST